MFPLSCLCSEDSKSNSSIRFPLTTATRVSSGWRASISMRIDIENSPGAAARPWDQRARHCLGQQVRVSAAHCGKCDENRVCCARQGRIGCGNAAPLLVTERTEGG